MGEVKIRNLDQDVIRKIDSLAAKQNMSREEYLRRCIKSLAIEAAIKETENRYENLVMTMVDVIQGTSETLEQIVEGQKELRSQIMKLEVKVEDGGNRG